VDVVVLVEAVVVLLVGVEELNAHGKKIISNRWVQMHQATSLGKKVSAISLLKFAGIGQLLLNSVRISLRS
jgi:hypothetical protein